MNKVGQYLQWGAIIRYLVFGSLFFSFCPVALAQINDPNDTSGPIGDWYVNVNGYRLILAISAQGGGYAATLKNDQGGGLEQLNSVTWNSSARLLEFRRSLTGLTQWYRGTIVEGILVGRFSQTNITSDSKPTNLYSYKWRITGWNYGYLTPLNGPVVFDLLINTVYRARLRIDRTIGGGVLGRLKFYAQGSSLLENPEEDVVVNQWTGSNIGFTRGGQIFVGTINGRNVSGSFTSGSGTYPWQGTRAEVLTYGIATKTTQQRDAWQRRTRKQLFHLIMANNPIPQITVSDPEVPLFTGVPDIRRDDNPAAYSQNYKLRRLNFTFTLPSWTGGPQTIRQLSGYLAKPNSGLSRYPLVLAINGHGGDAEQTMRPDNALFWYGDAFARRGYMVIAVDVTHRPNIDRVRFGSPSDPSTFLGYADINDGNSPHPSIKPPKPANFTDADWAYYTDWEEDGERAWDVMRALDYALSRPDVDPSRIIVTGLSLGGEIASYVGALDTRVNMSIPSGYSPDLNVLKYLGSHGCWNWSFADIRDYIDHADLFALTAPRPLIVETGKKDVVFSHFPQDQYILPPVSPRSATFAGDKQVMRRARAAYDDVNRCIHYLHSIDHRYRTGVTALNASIDPTGEVNLRYALRIEPQYFGELLWQADGSTTNYAGWNLFDYIRFFLNF